jgi:hypothetical protein
VLPRRALRRGFEERRTRPGPRHPGLDLCFENPSDLLRATGDAAIPQDLHEIERSTEEKESETGDGEPLPLGGILRDRAPVLP